MVTHLLDRKYNQWHSKIAPKPQRQDGNIDKLAAALVAEINLSQPPDMVIVIDDLEIANFHQPELVTSGFHDAVDWYIQNYNWASQRTKQSRIERLRECCSFHLLVPMVEAYFFGEVPDALILNIFINYLFLSFRR